MSEPMAVREVAGQLGVHHETVRNWVNQAEVDAGSRPGSTTYEKQRNIELERRASNLGIISLYKTELITAQGPWRTIADVEPATLSWVH